MSVRMRFGDVTILWEEGRSTPLPAEGSTLRRVLEAVADGHRCLCGVRGKVFPELGNTLATIAALPVAITNANLSVSAHLAVACSAGLLAYSPESIDPPHLECHTRYLLTDLGKEALGRAS